MWDYPRPPAVQTDSREVRVVANGRLVARTVRALRVLETASPPTFYLPAADVDMSRLAPAPGHSMCEWKGIASYWLLKDADGSDPVAWSYPEPSRDYCKLADHIAFYPGRVECYVEEERVRPQPGGFYGGWVTDELAGPIKGEPGTEGW